MNEREEMLDEYEKKFLKRHWRMAIVFAVIIVAAVIVAALVLLWFLATAQATALVPTTLGLWSIGHVFLFLLHLIFWELLLVGSWLLVVVLVIIFQWYMKLPEEERRERPSRGRREEGDAFGFLVTVTWLIVVWVDNRWNLAFESWTINDWVYSFLAAMLWDLLIFGIPILLGVLFWLRKELTEETNPATVVADDSTE